MMRKILFLFIVIFFRISYASAQSYEIKSFEGNWAKIGLYYKPASGILTITYLGDTLLINDYMSINNIKILNRVFLQINYVKRAGSNEDVINALLLYVRSNKLCQALHLNSLRSYDMRPTKYALFKLRIAMTSLEVSKYKLTLHIHNEKRIKSVSKENFNYDKVRLLDFDKKSKVFCNKHETLVGNYRLHEYNKTISEKKYLKNGIPVVQIIKDKYYYIDGNWYTKYNNDFYSMLL